MADDLQTQLDNLLAAYRSGASSVTYDGKMIAYRSGAEMQAAIVALQTAMGLRTQPTRVVARGDKGW
jgi:hypothetical protein